MRRVACLCLAFLLLFLAKSQASVLDDNKYDFWFRKYSHIYLPTVDWQLLKAQCFAESAFNERAISPVGALGICQFMPRTWEDVERGLKINGDPFDAKLNIQFASYYMAKLRNNWTSKRPEKDRHNLAMASYNAGLGNILKAQKKCNMAVLYPDIIQCLPQVTGNHATETIQYVIKIRNYYHMLLFY